MSSNLGGKATFANSPTPCEISMNLIQFRNPEMHKYAEQTAREPSGSPDLKLLCERGQLPRTAATRALALQAALPLADSGILPLRRSSATVGVAPFSTTTFLFSSTRLKTSARGLVLVFILQRLLDLATYEAKAPIYTDETVRVL